MSRKTVYLQMSCSNISHHLRKLKDREILEKRKEGKYRYYRLKDKNIEEIINRGIKHVET